jgi:hypothetical protein
VGRRHRQWSLPFDSSYIHSSMLSIVIVVVVNAKLDKRKPIYCLGKGIADSAVGASYKARSM